MTAEAGEFLQGKSIWDAEGPVISALAHEGHLLGKKSIHHQYAHCWRCKNPVIYRATEQWFASINDFRDKALKAVDDTRFIPSWGHDRLYNMIRDRQDWCISRQRSWGVPIPAFYCDDCGKWVITDETMKKVEEIVEKKAPMHGGLIPLKNSFRKASNARTAEAPISIKKRHHGRMVRLRLHMERRPPLPA